MFFSFWLADSIGHKVEEMLRSLMLLLSSLCYELIIFFYNIFVRLGSAEILTSSQVQKIYSRVTLILGIFMLFKLTFSFIQYLLNPETMSDKNKGAGKIVTKAILVVVLLGTTPFIFQQAYKLQNAVLESNILGKIILADNSANDTVSDFGAELSSYMFFSFYSLYDGEECQAGGDDLEDIRDEILYNHTFSLAKSCVNEDPVSSNNDWAINFAGNGVLSLVVSIFVLYIILSYCLSVGMRVIQLAFLQLIAPIPILSYLGEDKDGAFSNWVKRCFSTFIDIFIRMAIIYFVVYVIRLLIDESSSYYLLLSSTGNPTGMTKAWLIIIIIIGLLMFAKKAPELLKEILPKGIGSNIGFGFKDTNKYLKGLGGIGVAGGLAFLGNSGHTLSRALKTRNSYQDSNGNRFGRDKNGTLKLGKWDDNGNLISEVTDKDKFNQALKQRRRSVARVSASGVGSVFTQTGLAVGRNALHPAKGVGEAFKKQAGVNAKYRHAVDRGSTFGGRIREIASDITGFEFNNSAASLETDLEMAKARNATLDSMELPLKNSVSNFSNVKKEAESDLDGESLAGLSGKAQQLVRASAANAQYYKDNIGKTANYTFTSDDVGKTFISASGNAFTVQSSAVGITSSIKIDAGLAARAESYASDVRKAMTELRSNISIAKGQGATTIDLSAFSNYDAVFNAVSDISADEESANLNRAALQEVDDISKNLSNFCRRDKNTGNLISDVTIEADGSMYYNEYASDGSVSSSKVIRDSNGIIEYGGLKKVRNLSNALIGDNYEQRSSNDARIKEIEQSDEFMVAKANREAAHTLNDGGLGGGRIRGNNRGGHGGPGGPPLGPRP